ncbi:MAG: hypothetical protein DWH91_00915 [Planctomycetota bacterium]|nr:MAG: hypothetical protein DWH91_00915 [Planctomycetota bacterium]
MSAVSSGSLTGMRLDDYLWIRSGLMRSLLLTAWGLVTVSALTAAEVPADLVGLSVSVPAEKQLAVFDQLVADREWEAALTLIERLVSAESPDILVRIAPGQFLDLRAAIQRRLSGLPDAGLAFYRRRADPLAQRLWDRYLAERDETALQQIVEQYAATSIAGRATQSLIERAWRYGDIESVERLIPQLPDGDLRLAWLSQVSQPEMRPRSHRKSSPAGYFSVGAWGWHSPSTISTWPDPGTLVAVSTAHAAIGRPGTPRDLVMVNDGWQIRALREDTGTAYWPSEIAGDPGTVVQLELPEENLSLQRVAEGVFSGDRYFGILGDRPIWNTRPRLIPEESSLSALDLGTGEGRVLWRVASRDLPESGWGFHGPPVVRGQLLLAPICQAGAQTQLAIAAWDGDSGQLVWWRRIGTALGQPGTPVEATQLVVVGDRIAVRTSRGVVLVLDVQSGRICWASTQLVEPSQEVSPGETVRCLAACAGGVYATDLSGLAIQSFRVNDGTMQWTQSCTTRCRGITMAADQLLIAGSRLSCLRARSGQFLWEQGLDDPAAQGTGSPIWEGDVIYWPTRQALFGLEVQTGRIVERRTLSTGSRPEPTTLVAGRSVLILSTSTGATALRWEQESTPAESNGGR